MSSQGPSSVQFCPLCSKPFTLESSFDRHLSYCRRAQSRPRNRRKSCRACKLAKAKCSFHGRCSRCTAKGFDCVYDRPAITGNAISNADHIISHDEPIALSAGQEDLSSGLFDFEDTSFIVPTDLQQFNLQSYNFGNANDGDTAIATNPFKNPLDNIDLPSEPSDSTIEGFNLDKNSSPESLPYDGTIDNFATHHLNSFDDAGYLTRRRVSEPIVQQSANLVMQALTAVPEQMLRKATFPPFIHPYWDQPKMPEPLAICVRIAQMFASRTPEIEPFIWRTILSEQGRVLGQLPNLSKQDLLAAIQAHMVYLIMRVVDDVTQSPQWNSEMAMSLSVLCERFLHMCGGQFCQDEQTYPSPSWEDWIFAESRRRTSCVWFLITRTILVKTKSGCSTAEDPGVLPLPSPKTQWEARSQAAWMEELEAGTPALCTFRSLIDSKERSHEVFHAQRLASWNARHDGLGSLLNIAVAMV